MTDIFIKGENLNTDAHKRKKTYEDTGRRQVSVSQRERPGTDSPSQPSEKTNPAKTLISDF